MRASWYCPPVCRPHGGRWAACPLALGRRNWLFVGSQQAGERSAVLLSLIESAKLNEHDPWADLKDLFDRLPTLKQLDLAQLLPHHWRAPTPPAVAPIVKHVAA